MHVFDGIQLDRTQTLFALSMVFLLLVVVNGVFKLYINTYKGRLGERMLRRIRFELVDRILRFPPGLFKRVKSSEIATMVKDEVEPLGGFIGDAFVQPALLGGQALTALIFIIIQSFWLGMIAAVIVAVQLVIIPQMRKRLIRLGRERQLTARALSGRVGEIVDGIGAIHIHDTSNLERADIADRLGQIFKIRYDLYQWKFMVKFINNFLAQVTPFLFYLIGGYFALQGRLDIGQLVAVIDAYKDLPGPLKDLIDWDQARQDVQVKYQQVVEQFTIDEHPGPETADPDDRAGRHPLSEPLAAVNLTLSDDSGARLLERVSLQIERGETVAIVGTAAGGAEALAEAFARLVWPNGGKITVREQRPAGNARIDARPAHDLCLVGCLAVPGHAARQSALRAEARAADAMTYEGARRRATQLEHRRGAQGRQSRPRHAARTGSTTRRPARRGPTISSRWCGRCSTRWSCRRTFSTSGCARASNREHHTEIVDRIVEVRQALRERLEAEGLSDLVAFFEPGAYNSQATIGENLLFGTATGTELVGKELARNAYFRSVLSKAGSPRRSTRWAWRSRPTPSNCLPTCRRTIPSSSSSPS